MRNLWLIYGMNIMEKRQRHISFSIMIRSDRYWEQLKTVAKNERLISYCGYDPK